MLRVAIRGDFKIIQPECQRHEASNGATKGFLDVKALRVPFST